MRRETREQAATVSLPQFETGLVGTTLPSNEVATKQKIATLKGKEHPATRTSTDKYGVTNTPS